MQTNANAQISGSGMDVSLTRCTVVWLAATGACLASSRWAWHDLRGWSSFDAALPGVAALALIGCAAWAWWVTTVVVAGAVRRRSPSRASRTGSLHHLVLVACGLAALCGASVGPATAVLPEPGVFAADQVAPEPAIVALAGLSLPSRTTGLLPGGPAGAAHSATAAPGLQPRWTRATVRRGDSLWSIAESLLPANAPARAVTDLMHRLHDLNLAEIGSDPDLIHPGHQLRTPLGVRPNR